MVKRERERAKHQSERERVREKDTDRERKNKEIKKNPRKQVAEKSRTIKTSGTIKDWHKERVGEKEKHTTLTERQKKNKH